jgi:uncharacterized UPF0160 family protein
MGFDEIMNNLHEIIGCSILCENVYKTYYTASDLIRNGTVKLKLEPKLKTLLNGMNFQHTENGQ